MPFWSTSGQTQQFTQTPAQPDSLIALNLRRYGPADLQFCPGKTLEFNLSQAHQRMRKRQQRSVTHTTLLLALLLLTGNAWQALSEQDHHEDQKSSWLGLVRHAQGLSSLKAPSSVSRKLQQSAPVVEQPVLPDHAPHCMDIEGLAAAVKAAAWQGQVSQNGTLIGPQAGARVVILTLCDLYCLEQLFEMWMAGIRSAAGGDQSRHVVLVALGEPAMQFCMQQQAHHPHQCVLDRACGVHQDQTNVAARRHRHRRTHRSMDPDEIRPFPAREPHRHLMSTTRRLRGTPTLEEQRMSFATHGYFLALQQKLMWARQVLALNTSVLWLDVDVLVYQALLPRLVSGQLSESDMAVAGESCDPKYRQEEEALKFVKKAQFHQNGGLWIVHPTPGGMGIMDVWAGENFRLTTEARVRMHRPLLDQDVLNKVMIGRLLKTRAIQMRPDGQYAPVVNATGGDVFWHRPKGARVHKLSIQIYQNQNGGWCGCPPDWRKNERLQQLDPLNSNNVTCQVSQAWVSNWVTMHFNGLAGMHEKVSRMASLRRVDHLGALP